VGLNDADETPEVFKLTLRSNKILYEQPFEPMKYYRDSWEFRNQDFENLTRICDDFGGLNVRLPFSFFEEYVIDKYENNSQAWQVMMIIRGVIAHLAVRVDKVYVFVKGYSDTTENESWEGYLNKDYFYEDIPYYRAINKMFTSYLIADDNINIVNIPQEEDIGKGMYSNRDLPFLRAKFVMDNYIVNFLTECTNVEFKAGILEGEVISGNDQKMRNVEVYIVVKRNIINKLADPM